MKTQVEPDVTKLPKWAQQRIADLQRERNGAVRALREYLDNQTASSLYTRDYHCIGEQVGPTVGKRWIQSDHVIFQLNGGEMKVTAMDGFERLEICALQSGMVIAPKVTNVISIRPSDRYNPT